jgi:hypothetical protein
VIPLHPADLAGNDVERLVPADPLVLRTTTLFGVPVTAGIKPDALHRIQKPPR